MPKKRVGVSLRKSSPAPDASAEPAGAESAVLPATEQIDSFVSGAALVIEKVAAEIPPAKLEEIRRRGPAGYRELTLYLPEALAERLTAFCLQQNLDVSRVVAAALEQYMTARLAKRALGISARRLLADLAAWVRAALGSRSETATAAS
jgi:hypothetical protein